MLRILTVIGAILGLAVSAQAAVKMEKVVYKHGDVDCIGYIAWDDAIDAPRPGVVVFHEFWGLDAYAKRRAEQLAGLGYIAFAADLYGQGKLLDHPKDASAMAGAVRGNVEDWRKRGLEAIDELKKHPQCDKENIAAIGYCFGGSTVQQLAFSGADLKAVASFHGAIVVPTADQVKAAKAELLICNGADDKFIPDDAIKNFKESLDKNGGKYRFINYPGAVHSFTVPEADETAKKFNIALKYNEDADKKSWAEMLALFKKTLGK